MMKKCNRVLATVLALFTALGTGFAAGCKEEDNSSFYSSSNEENSSEYACESICSKCGNCLDLECEEEPCKGKCECEYTLAWNFVNATAHALKGELPSKVKYGEAVEFTAEAPGENLTVKVNGTLMQPMTERTYKLLVTEDCTIEITADATSAEKTYALTDATVVERDGAPYYLLKGVYENYTENELRNMYFDMQNNSYYNDQYGWTVTQVKYDLVLDRNEFFMYVNLSGFPVDTCLIPHFNGEDSAGDIKVTTSDGAFVKINNIRYQIDVGATDWGLATVTITSGSGFVSAPSDTTPPTMSEITNYDYFDTEEIPRIDIATKDGIAIDDESLIKGWKVPDAVYEYDYVESEVSVSNCEGYEMESTAAEVKVRGNYTSTYPKKPIRIKFAKKAPMCGLNDGNAFKNWVLLAEYKDSSMLRNSVAFYLGNSILESDGYYCSDFRYVEVYLNGVYNGLYLLVEQQEVKGDRIDLPEAIDPDDEPDHPDLKNVKIGYSIEYDGYYYTEKASERFELAYDRLTYENDAWMTPYQNGFTIKSDVYFEEQRAFIQKCVQNIWDIVYDATYKPHTDLATAPYYTLDENGDKVADPSIKTPREAVEKVLDVRSLVDVYILNEICMDADLGWSSFYMSLDMSETGNRLLTFEAPWDFDSALGSSVADNTKLCSLNVTRHNSGTVTPNPWLMLCGKEGWFWSHVQAKWKALKEAGTFDGVLTMIDYYANNYASAYAKNFEKWTECIGRKMEGQQIDLIGTFKTQAEAAAYLKNWVSERIDNLEKLIDGKVLEFCKA